MIRWLLLLLVAVFWSADVVTGDISLAPGLSVKNAMLYLIAACLILRRVMGDTSGARLPRIQAYFAVWIGYALATTVVAGLLIHYTDYHLTDAVIELKAQLIDPAIFCLAVFYGLRSDDDVRFFVKGVVGAICLANVLTLGSVAGLVPLAVRVGDAGAEYGRVFGFFGHANATGELIACLLPAMLVISSTGSRPSRIVWYAGTLASVIVLILTVSREAYVAAAVAAVWGAWLCRRYVDLSRYLTWALMALVVLAAGIALAALIDPPIADVIKERFLGQSTSIDLGDISSGRTDIWAFALSRMMQAPITFVTGFGWYAYQSMGFILGTHNYYLELWFDLGLVGLSMFILIMRRAIVLALQAMASASERECLYLTAFVLALLAFVVGNCFGVFFAPIPYIFMYMGAMLRAAVNIQLREAVRPVAAEPQLAVGAHPKVRARAVPVTMRRAPH